MVEIFTPFVLVLMVWQNDNPQESMRVTQRVYIDEETCMKAGRERQELLARAISINAQFAWKCLPQAQEISKYAPLKRSE